MQNNNREKAMESPKTLVPITYYIHPVTGDIYDRMESRIIIKDADRHPDSPPYTNSEGETFDVWTGELLSRPAEDEARERSLSEQMEQEKRAATVKPRLDEEK